MSFHICFKLMKADAHFVSLYLLPEVKNKKVLTFDPLLQDKENHK